MSKLTIIVDADPGTMVRLRLALHDMGIDLDAAMARGDRAIAKMETEGLTDDEVALLPDEELGLD